MLFQTIAIRRREMLAALAGLGALPSALRADATSDPMMLPKYLAARLNPIASKWASTVDGLKTRDAIEERNRFVRAKERELLGGLPERSPLAPRVAKVTERDGYRIENVMYQSRPEFWVTANLYVPTRGKGPFPGILSPCGHYDIARLYPDYQFAYRNMVESGFVVLAFDPIGQGERRHFWNPATGATEDEIASTTEHSLAGHLLRLLGEDLNQYCVWDGMRGIDYLLTRPEVDPDRIGCAGHSGGGTQTMYLSCADQRIQCVAIHEGGLSHQWPIDLETSRLTPADSEQNLFGAATYGMDFAELHAALSPRPLLVTIENYNPAFDQAARDVKRRYERLGADAKFATVEAQARHAWTRKLRIASTDWLCRSFYGHPGPTEEPDYQPEPAEVLRCLPNGSLRYSGFETIFTRIAKEAAALHPVPPPDLSKVLAGALRFSKADGRIEASETSGTASIPVVPGITLPALIVRAPKSAHPPVVYLDEAGADVASDSGLLSRIAQTDRDVIAVDVRGIGRTNPRTANPRKGRFVQVLDTETWMAYSAWQLDESLLGMRVADAIRSVDFALSLGGAGAVTMIGKGMGALWALFAAALDPRIQSVICHGGLLSYATMAAADRTLHGANIVIPGVLKSFDLPHVAASIAGRPLHIVDPVDALKNPVEMAIAEHTYRIASERYQQQGARGRFQITRLAPDTDVVRAYFGQA